MLLSELICKNTELWMQWNAKIANGQDVNLSTKERALNYRESEQIIEQINYNITIFDTQLSKNLL